MNFENEFNKLLLESDQKNLEEFLIMKGKHPKVISPIIFNMNNNTEVQPNDE